MKFTYSWLLEHLDTTATPQEIAAKLTSIGLEVDAFTDLSKKYEPFIIAEIVEAEKHPNADKLRVCKVNNGAEVLQIVCGAANARAGIKVVLAPIGANIPNGNFQIKKSKIRDVESNGMLCSAAELELSNDAEGIIELKPDAPLGTSYAKYAHLNDSLYEINITPNRADALGVYGIARDLAAAGLGKLKPLKIENQKSKIKNPLSITSPTYYTARYFSGVTNAESPAWLKQRLQAIGQKPISALVDITNFILFDLGQPLHVFDADKLASNIEVRTATKGEKINALNNVTYELTGSETVIASGGKPVALAGIIGGVETAVSTASKNILLEAAWFDRDNTTKTGRLHQIITDSRFHFERGIDAENIQTAADKAAELIIQICGGRASAPASTSNKPETPKPINFNFAKIKSFGGLDIPQTEAEKILHSLGFTINGSQITPPSWRADVEGSADIVEEILRIHGYDKVPAQIIPFKTATAPLKNPARHALAARGLIETVTYSFMKPSLAAKFGGGRKELQLQNPISVELSEMRPSIIPNLLEAAAKNANRGFKNLSLFEIGPVFAEKEQTIITGIRTGKNAERNIYGDYRDVDVFDAKADLLSSLEATNAPEGRVLAEAPSYYHPGKSGGIYLGKTCLGWFGEIHPKILKLFDISTPAAAFEMFPENIPTSKKKYKQLEISDLQSASRDFAFILDQKIKAGDIIAAITKTDMLINNVGIFDIYTGDKIETGKKSLALSVQIQPKDKNLTDKEIEEISAKITNIMAEKFAAALRK